MVSDAERRFICFLALCVSSLEKSLFKTWWLVFHLSCRALYSGDTWFANVFSHSIDCFLILLFFLMYKILEFSFFFSQKLFFFFCYCAFAVVSQIVAISEAVKPLSCVFSENFVVWGLTFRAPPPFFFFYSFLN